VTSASHEACVCHVQKWVTRPLLVQQQRPTCCVPRPEPSDPEQAGVDTYLAC
jgi:hypothetical protein